MPSLNISGTLNAFRMLANPRLCLPQVTISDCNGLPMAIPKHIKGVVLDKDNCFAEPHSLKVWPNYSNTMNILRKKYPGHSLLIVSNSAGATSEDPDFKLATELETNTGIEVLRHDTKKPGCHTEILEHFKKYNITSDSKDLAIVGDRLFTDIMMANMMGSCGIWIKSPIVNNNSFLYKFEKFLYNTLRKN